MRIVAWKGRKKRQALTRGSQTKEIIVFFFPASTLPEGWGAMRQAKCHAGASTVEYVELSKARPNGVRTNRRYHTVISSSHRSSGGPCYQRGFWRCSREDPRSEECPSVPDERAKGHITIGNLGGPQVDTSTEWGWLDRIRGNQGPIRAAVRRLPCSVK